MFSISHVISYLRNPDPLITVKLLRAFGAKIGEKTIIKRSLYLDNVYEDENSTGDFMHLSIGNNCYIGDCVYFDLSNKIIIGNNVVVSGGVSFITHADCNRSQYLQKKFPRICEALVVKDGSWVAFRACVLQGVTIGINSVIAAYSLVKNGVPDYTLVAGIPAQKIRSIKYENKST